MRSDSRRMPASTSRAKSVIQAASRTGSRGMVPERTSSTIPARVAPWLTCPEVRSTRPPQALEM
jgi:hypothetical protein